MNSKIKNIILGIIVVAIVSFLVYIFFIKKNPVSTSLTSSSTSNVSDINGSETSAISNSFISLLLSVKSIKLDDSIFSNTSFISLKDSSIILVQEQGNEGRSNPFAPIGSESMVSSSSSGLSVNTNLSETNSGIDNVINSTTDTNKSSNTGTSVSPKNTGSKQN